MRISEVSLVWSLKVEKKSGVGIRMIEIEYALQKASQNKPIGPSALILVMMFFSFVSFVIILLS